MVVKKKAEKNLPAVATSDDVDVEVLDEEEYFSLMESIENSLEEIDSFYSVLSSPDRTFSEKINEIVRIKTAMLVPIMKGAAGKFVDKNTMESAVATSGMLSNIESSLYDKAEFELRQEIDFHHPKIQKAFSLMIEGVIESMEESGLDELQITNFINIFGTNSVGFEEALTKRMKGLSAAALDQVDNPFLKKFKEVQDEIYKKYKEESKDV